MMCAVAEADNGSGTRAERIAGLDTGVAHPARVYDYRLGGHFLQARIKPRSTGQLRDDSGESA